MKSYNKLKSKKKIVENRSTLDELHDNKMKEFELYYDTLPQKKIELDICTSKLSSDPNNYHLKLENSKLKEEIVKMEHKTDMCKYLLNVNEILMKASSCEEINEDITDESLGGESCSLAESVLCKNSNTQNSIVGFLNFNQRNTKGDILEEYLNAQDRGISVQKKLKKNIYYCENCEIPMIFNSKECFLSCTQCGNCNQWQDPDTPQWSDEVDVSKAYKYKRLSYFVEHIYRMQAQECTIIPEHVINNIAMELRKHNINSPENIKSSTIKDILRSLNLSCYYDNINSIVRILSGKEVPKFPEEFKNKLICMFIRTIEPFEKYKHMIPSRNNYLSYPYVIRKLIKIIAYEENNEDILEFENYFSFLKSRQKLWDQEKVWNQICVYNKWPFFRSI